MSLKHILLGLLDQPQSGYDVKQNFELTLKNFWNAELSQIYPLLSGLEQQGYLQSEVVKSKQGPSRRIYHRLAQGQQELDDWLKSGPKIPRNRIGYLAQVFFLDRVSDQERLGFIKELREIAGQQYEFLDAVAKEYPLENYQKPQADSDGQQNANEYLSRILTIHHGLMRLQALMDWCDLAELWFRKTLVVGQ